MFNWEEYFDWDGAKDEPSDNFHWDENFWREVLSSQDDTPVDIFNWDEHFWRNLLVSDESAFADEMRFTQELFGVEEVDDDEFEIEDSDFEDNELSDGFVWGKKYWKALFLYQESALGDSVFFEQELEANDEEDDDDFEDEEDDFGLEDDGDVDQNSPYYSYSPGTRKLLEEYFERKRAREEEAAIANSFLAKYPSGHENKPPANDFKDRANKFYRDAVELIKTLLILGFIYGGLIAIGGFLIDQLRPEPTQSVVNERLSSADYSDSYGDSEWGCPDGCTYHKDGCDIKGNISYNSGKKIYHLPSQEFYGVTTINTDYGERWFCTEEEARANGWRKSSN